MINPQVDRYQIHKDDLGELQMIDIPAHSLVEIMGLPRTDEGFEFQLYGRNDGEDGECKYLSVYGGARVIVKRDDSQRTIARFRRAFPQNFEFDDYGNPLIRFELVAKGVEVEGFMNFEFKDCGHTFVRDAVAPFILAFQRLVRPEVYVFICHASEDKTYARALALHLGALGAQVWFDEWEIKVGESIVEKIDSALDTVTHLILLLSSNSVSRPWVKKELSSALMRQLSVKSIIVLPILLDDSKVPAILADIKYADARFGLDKGFAQIDEALFSLK